MTRQVAAIIGSGTVAQTYSILPPSDRGSLSGAEGVRTGIQVMLANPEDLNSVAAFASSGVTVGTTAVEVIAPGINPLPRCRNIILENTGGQAVLIGHRANIQDPEAFELGTTAPNNRIELPLLHNVSVFARTTTGSSVIKLIVY